MSLLNRMKGRGQKDGVAVPDAPESGAPGGNDPTTGAAAHEVPTQHPGQDFDTSIISEAAPSEMADFSETRLQDDELAAAGAAGTGLPLIGQRPFAQQQRILFAMLGIGLVGLVLTTVLSLLSANRGAVQVSASGQALMQSQRLAKSVSQALIGSAPAFPEVKESADVLVKNVRGLRTGDADIPAAPSGVQEAIEPLLPLVDRAEKGAKTVLDQQQVLTQVGQALRAINRQSAELLEAAETVSSLKLQQGASTAELSAVGQLVMLTQRIGKSANEFLTTEGVSPEAVFLLGKDLNTFRELGQGLLDGNPELRLPAARDAQTRERLVALMKQYEQIRTQAGAILANLQGLVSAREAQAGILADSEPLRKGLEAVQERLGRDTGFGGASLLLLLLSAVVLLLGGAGLLRLYVRAQ